MVEFANNLDPDVAAHHQLPHLDLHCLLSSLWILHILLGCNFFCNFTDKNFVFCFLGTLWVKDHKRTNKFGEFISPAEVALVCLKFILSFIKFCSLVTKLWLICGF